ncbi:MAG TPA: hypothetical protein VEU29_01980 [Actinomycetota bacterium]|nr:hypothetical protein [Actinomycetota bacterium]
MTKTGGAFACLQVSSRRLRVVAATGAGVHVVAEVPRALPSDSSRFATRLTWSGSRFFVCGPDKVPPLVWDGATWEEIDGPSFEAGVDQTWRVHGDGSVTVVAEEGHGLRSFARSIAYRAPRDATWQSVALPPGLVVSDVLVRPEGILSISGGIVDEGAAASTASCPFLGEVRDGRLEATPPALSKRDWRRLTDAGVETFGRIDVTTRGTVVAAPTVAFFDVPRDFLVLDGKHCRVKRLPGFLRTWLDLPDGLVALTTDGGGRRTNDFGHTWQSFRLGGRLARETGGRGNLSLTGAAYSRGTVAISFSFHDSRKEPSELLLSGLALTEPDFQRFELVDVAESGGREMLAVTTDVERDQRA